MSFDDEDENKPNETRTGKEVSTVKHSNAPTTASDNPFADYADAAMSNTLNGTLLIFAKGDYLAGKEKRPVAIGTRMVVNMDSFSIGPVRWSGGKPVESFMGRVVDRFVPPPRRAAIRRTPSNTPSRSSLPTRKPARFSRFPRRPSEAAGRSTSFARPTRTRGQSTLQSGR
jgi:hypothetical protein